MTVAAAVLALIALAAFALGFKGSYSRPGEATPAYAGATSAPPSTGDAAPTQARALTEPVAAPTSDQPPVSSAAPKAKPKPKVVDEDAADAAADQAPPRTSHPANTDTGDRNADDNSDSAGDAAPAPRTPASSSRRAAAPRSSAPAPDAIGDLIPPH